ncbi:MAG: inorganic phosphate transporter [Dermatophilaceae bacterium]
MHTASVILVIVLALGFTYTNGFHDSANAVATSISTRALTPRIALAMAAFANFLGAFFGGTVAQTVGSGIIEAPAGNRGLAICAAALVGAISWNLLTWWRGLPSSSSHALIGGLGGAALAAGGQVHWNEVIAKVLLPMVLLPVAGLVGGYAVMRTLVRAFRRSHPADVVRGFRLAQTVSASAMAFGHGMQDAAKGAGVIVLALTVGEAQPVAARSVPWWVLLLCALVLSAGTYAGGWRIMRTLGRRLVDLDSPRGFAAEATAAVMLYAATALRAPVSTTHTIASAIIGVGVSRSRKSIRWDVVRTIAGAWLLTFPAAGVIAAVVSTILT